MGAVYQDARAWGARLGLTATWLESSRRLRLSSQWTTLILEADRREVLINDVRVFLGEPLVSNGGSLWLGVVDAKTLLGAIVRPESVDVAAPRLQRICIDAGHGGNDTGTQNKKLNLQEKRYTLDVAQRVKALLEARGFAVIMTRTDDRYVDLDDRARISNRSGADLFVSIHFNAFPQPGIHGTETYILTRRFQRSSSTQKREKSDAEVLPGNAMDPWNAVLGYSIHRQLLGKLGSFDRGLKLARFKVLTMVEAPGVLIESGYLSHDSEGRKIATAAYRADIAEAIVAGIVAYAGNVKAAGK